MRNKLVVVATLALTAGSLLAQGGGGGRAGQRRVPPAGAPPAGESLPNRAMLEQRVQQQLGQRVKQALGLTDQQMTKLQATNRSIDEKRRILLDQERDVRMSLRDEMVRPDSARQGQLSALMDRMIKVQRQRVDLLEQEQKELSAFLTPMQRVRYMTLEENIRRRMQQMRQQQMNGRGQPPMDGDGMQPGMQPGMEPGMPGMRGRAGMAPPAGQVLPRRRPLQPSGVPPGVPQDPPQPVR